MVLITVYSKTEQADIAPEVIRQIILAMEETKPPDGVSEQHDNEAS